MEKNSIIWINTYNSNNTNNIYILYVYLIFILTAYRYLLSSLWNFQMLKNVQLKYQGILVEKNQRDVVLTRHSL